MSEKEGERGPAVFVHGQKKPKAPGGYKYIAERHHDKRNLTVGWKLISTTGHDDPEGFAIPAELREKKPGGFSVTPEDLEKSRKRYFPSIEDSLPKGDRD